jgi:hypothetical protein
VPPEQWEGFVDGGEPQGREYAPRLGDGRVRFPAFQPDDIGLADAQQVGQVLLRHASLLPRKGKGDGEAHFGRGFAKLHSSYVILYFLSDSCDCVGIIHSCPRASKYWLTSALALAFWLSGVRWVRFLNLLSSMNTSN